MPLKVKYGLIAAGAAFFAVIAVVFLLNEDSNAPLNKPFKSFENVKPPKAGDAPDALGVTGIYRTVHTSLLQLRRSGEFDLTDSAGADTGGFTLTTGHFEVHSHDCGGALGSYTVEVTGKNQAGSAALHFITVDDECARRRVALTRDPWIYA